MAVSINMRGKAATGGGADGGGKSKLRRDWDALLDSPNPNTQQRFEEDFAMADPDSNMFNAKKILSNRNNLKNYANKSIPESRMNAMAAKIAAKQMKPLQDHISKTLDREITRLSRQTRPGANIGDAGLRAISERQSRIANAMSTMGRLTGGKYALPVASQEVLSHAQSRIGVIQQAKQAQQAELLRAATNPANAHVSEFMKHKVKMEAQQQKQQALWMKNPADAHVAMRDAAVAAGVADSARFINATGRAGQSAAFRGDRRELRKMEKNLDRISSNTSKELELHKKNGTVGSVGYLQSQGVLNSVNAQRAAINRARAMSPNAHKLGSGFLGGLGAAELLEAGSAVAAVGGAALGAPFLLSAMAHKVIGGASPYMPLSQQMGRFGRAYGGSKLSFMNQVMPRSGNALPTWMLTSGIMPDQVAGIMGSYGAPIGSLSKFKQVMGAVGYANNMLGFGGMSKNTYAGILGQGAAMGILPGGVHGEISVSLGGTKSNISDNVNSSKQYMALWGRVMQTAVKSGLNRAEVLQSMKHSLSQAAGTSGLGVSARSVLGFGARLMQSGAPSMRTGAGIISMEANLQHGSMSVGKLPVQTMAFMEYERKMNNGHLPTSLGGIKRILGVREYDALSKNKAGRMALANIAKLGKHGYAYFASTHLAHLASNDYNLTERIARSFAGSGLTGGGLGPSITAAESGTTWRQQMAYAAGGGLLPLAQQKAMHEKAAASYGKLLLFEGKHKSELRRMEIGSMTNDLAAKLRHYSGNAQNALRGYAYGYGGAAAGKGYGAANVEMQYAQSMGWRGSSTFVRSRKSAYKQALLAKGVPPKDVNRILADAERKNVNPLLLASIPGSHEDQSWSLIARNPKSTAFGLGQLTRATAQSYSGNHTRWMHLYNRGEALSGQAAPYIASPNMNASIRDANLTSQVQHLRSSYIIFETLATNMSSLAGVAKLADKAIGNLAQSAMEAAKQLAHRHVIKGMNDLVAGTGPKHAMQLHVIKNP